MLSILAVLATAELSSWPTIDNSLPVQCAFQNFRPSDPLLLSQLFIIAEFLGQIYSNRIARLYSCDPDWDAQDLVAQSLRTKLGKEHHLRNLMKIVIASSWNSKAGQRAVMCRIRQRQRLLKLESNLECNQIKWSCRLAKFRYLDREILNFFLGELSTLLFGVTYGVTLIT